MAPIAPRTKDRTATTPAGAPPTLRSLLRLAGWGFCAALALGVTMTLTQTDRGAERLQQAVANLYTPEKPETARVPTPPVTVAQKTFDAEQETTRLAGQLQSLTADRDRLAARVATLERSFDDITGSVKQITTSRITAPPPAPVKAETPKSETAKPEAKVEPTPKAEPAAKAELPRLEPIKDQHEPAKAASAIVPSSPASTAAAPQPPTISAPAVVAAAPPPRAANDNQRPTTPPSPPRIADSAPAVQPSLPAVRLVPLTDKAKDTASRDAADKDSQLATGSIPANSAAKNTLPAKPEYAIDLGGAPTVDALRALWLSTKAAHAPLLDKLEPAAILRPTGRNGAPQLRLMAGPFNEASTAAAVCRAFAQGRGSCRPFAYDGQKLPLH
ncbi:MAG: hypothetical protein ACTHLY_17640 [Pseudolabrys sp.]